MPRIPNHLARLPVWRGLPVPYINCWGREVDDGAWTIRYDPQVGSPAWFTADNPRGSGPAFLAKQNLQRQREVAVRGLCQVCRRLLVGSRRLLIFGGSTDSVEVGGRERVLVSEPWLCARCLDYTVSTCRGVRRALRAGELSAMVCSKWELETSVGWHEAHGPDLVAVMRVKIRPVAGAWLSIDELEGSPSSS